VVPDLLAYYLEYLCQRLVLIHRFAEGMIGVDTGKIQCRLLEIGAFKGLYLKTDGAMNTQLAIVIHSYNGGGDFQDGVCSCDETAGFYIYDNWQKATETIANLVVAGEFQGAVLSRVRTRQEISSPARSGVRVSSPRGCWLGTVQLCFARVMLSVLRGRP